MNYPGKVIGKNESQLWQPAEFLSNFSPRNLEIRSKKVELEEVRQEFWIDQNSEQNFNEFSKQEVKNRFGYSRDEIYHDACGISALYAALGALSKGFRDSKLTVGMLAIQALSYHRNDLLDKSGKVVKKGTPVFNLKSGWYHDALIYTAGTFGVSGFRLENVNLENVVGEASRLSRKSKHILVIISVKGNYRNPQIKRGVSHMIILNGFKTDKDGVIREIRISDSSKLVSLNAMPNSWVRVNRRFKNSFLHKAIVIYT